MTCIVGVISKAAVWMGGDSYTECAGSSQIRKQPKVFRKGGMLIGFSGDARVGQVLQYQLALPKATKGMDAYEYLSARFSDAVREAVTNAGYCENKSGQESMDSSLLMAFDGRLFHMCGGFCVNEAASEYQAIGSGADYAMGVLFDSKRASPRERIERALKAAVEHNSYVRPPFHIEKL